MSRWNDKIQITRKSKLMYDIMVVLVIINELLEFILK